MFLVRIVGLLAILAIGTSLALYLFTRDRRYLQWSLRLVRYTVAAALVFFAALALERLAVLL